MDSNTLRLFGSVDKTAVVVDIGTRWIKCGLAGEGCPRKLFLFPDLEELLFRCHSQEEVSSSEWNKVARNLFRKLYFDELLTKPKERSVLVMFHHDAVQSFRKAVVHAVLNIFGAPSLCMTSCSGLALYPSGLKTGIVIDIGYLETRVLAICEGLLLEPSVKVIPVGAFHVMCAVGEPTVDNISLSMVRKNLLHDEAYLESKISSVGFDDDESQQRLFINTLFNTDELELTLDEAVKQSALSCPHSVRPQVIQNIVLAGGLSSCNAIAKLLSLRLAEQDPNWTKKLADLSSISRFKVPTNTLCWLGGSIAAGLESFPKNCLTMNDVHREPSLISMVPSTEQPTVVASNKLQVESKETGMRKDTMDDEGSVVIKTVVSPPENPFRGQDQVR